jgi:putrescine transport system permease protein
MWFQFFRGLYRRLGVLGREIQGKRGRAVVLGVPMLVMGLFFVLPFLIILKISFSEAALAQPPYSALYEWIEGGYLTIKLNFANYLLLKDDALYLGAYLNSIKVAAISTLFALLIGYPLAYGIARSPKSWRLPLLMLIILPFWTSFLIRIYAWIGLLNTTGVINNALLGLGLIDQPLALIRTEFAVYIGIVYCYLPFMVLPLVATLVRLDQTLLEAAADLGCRPLKAFFKITLPLSLPGIAAGCLLVFIPAIGEFVVPDLLGGPDSVMIGRALWTEFFTNNDWPLAASIAVAMLAFIVVPILLFEHLQERRDPAVKP